MQQILTIDTSIEPAIASLVRVSGRNIEVIEQHEQLLNGLFSLEHLRAQSVQVENVEQASSTQAPAPQAEDKSALHHLLKKFRHPWTASYLVISPFESTSLNVSLPFGDPKRIERIIDLEVQDLLPFETDEFVLNHLPVVSDQNDNFDVHVNLIPKQIISASLQICRNAEFEPLMISSPGGTITSIYHLAPDYVADNSAIILEHGGWYYISIAFDGEPHVDRIIRPNTQLNGNAEQALIAQIRISINAAEQKYGKKIDIAYLIARTPELRRLQESLGRRVERLQISELLKRGSCKENIAQLGAYFAQDSMPAIPFANYRVREFSYRPELKELLRGLRELRPHALACLALVLAFLIGVYLVRAYRISATEQAIAQQIERVLPGTPLPAGKELAILQGRISALSQELETLGSATRYSPLKVFRSLSEVFPKGQDVEVDGIEIRGERVVVDGTAPSYTTIERIKVLLRKESSFCRIKDETRNAARRRIAFTFTINLCE